MTTISAEPAIRLAPWGGLSEVAEDGQWASAAHLLKEAKLDWGVELKPLYHYETKVEDGHKKQRLVKNGNFEVRRKDTEQVLAPSVTADYVTYDNVDVFAFADNLVDNGEASFVAAGPAKQGRKVFVVTKLGKEVKVAGEDAHDLYLFLRTGHDGGTALTAMVIPFRLRCFNAVPMALRTAKVKWSIPHVKTMEGRLAEARDALKLSYDYADEFQREAERLMKITVSDTQVEKLFDRIVPARRGSRDEVLAGLIDTYRTDPTNGYQGTGYGVLQTVTNYYDHVIQRKTAEVRLESIVDGEALKMTNQAAAYLRSMYAPAA